MRLVLHIGLWLCAASVQAQVQWTEPTHLLLGDVQRRQTYTLKYPFTNTGDRPVVLDNVRTDCGCTAPDWSRDPILPGDASVIVLEFTPTSKGRHRKKARVWIRDEKRPVTLSFEAIVR